MVVQTGPVGEALAALLALEGAHVAVAVDVAHVRVFVVEVLAAHAAHVRQSTGGVHAALMARQPADGGEALPAQPARGHHQTSPGMPRGAGPRAGGRGHSAGCRGGSGPRSPQPGTVPVPEGIVVRHCEAGVVRVCGSVV